jgi:hypothetical protein
MHPRFQILLPPKKQILSSNRQPTRQKKITTLKASTAIDTTMASPNTPPAKEPKNAGADYVALPTEEEKGLMTAAKTTLVKEDATTSNRPENCSPRQSSRILRYASYALVTALVLLLVVMAIQHSVSRQMSCVGDGACEGNSGTVGLGSCNGIGACRFNTGNVTWGSCNGNEVCNYNTGNVQHMSCNGDFSCQGNQGPIRFGSCNGDGACHNNTGPVAKGACNGKDTCHGNDDSISPGMCGEHTCPGNGTAITSLN